MLLPVWGSSPGALGLPFWGFELGPGALATAADLQAQVLKGII